MWWGYTRRGETAVYGAHAPRAKGKGKAGMHMCPTLQAY
jgi:hypothetical protein